MNIEACAKLFSTFSGKKLFVGFSGGADSCTALLLTAYFAEKFDFSVIAVHINHHLRGEESDQEEKAAEAFASEHKVPFICRHLRDLPKKNLEAAARAARLQIWQELAAAPNCAVVLGHHADDRTETLLLRLLRGSNSSGLAALRPVRKVGNVTFVRPLLEFRRSEIEQFLKEKGISGFARDSSNSDERFLRNFLRENLLKKLYQRLPGGFSGLTASLEALEEDADFLETEAAQKYTQIRQTPETDIVFWRHLPSALQSRVLRLYLTELYGRDFIPTRALICRFRQELLSDSNTKRILPITENLRLVFAGNKVYQEKTQTEFPSVCWYWHQQNLCLVNGSRFECTFVPFLPETVSARECFFDAELLPDELWATSRKPGDKLIPFGKKTPVLLKKLRIDRNIPADVFLPLLRDSAGEICWAPEIRHCNVAPVTPKTRHILRICWTPAKE